jgi:hypothetical protein
MKRRSGLLAVPLILCAVFIPACAAAQHAASTSAPAATTTPAPTEVISVAEWIVIGVIILFIIDHAFWTYKYRIRWWRAQWIKSKRIARRSRNYKRDNPKDLLSDMRDKEQDYQDRHFRGL